MKKIILISYILILFVISSCKKEQKKITLKGYFVVDKIEIYNNNFNTADTVIYSNKKISVIDELTFDYAIMFESYIIGYIGCGNPIKVFYDDIKSNNKRLLFATTCGMNSKVIEINVEVIDKNNFIWSYIKTDNNLDNDNFSNLYLEKLWLRRQ